MTRVAVVGAGLAGPVVATIAFVSVILGTLLATSASLDATPSTRK